MFDRQETRRNRGWREGLIFVSAEFRVLWALALRLLYDLRRIMVAMKDFVAYRYLILLYSLLHSISHFEFDGCFFRLLLMMSATATLGFWMLELRCR